MARGHEPDRYTVSEKARLVYLVGRLGHAIETQGRPGKWDAAIARLQADAVAREEAEEAERQERAAAARKDKAAARRR
ncbi:hypothetical protein ACIQM4_34485 [Streptomyces sp. NPDC091272]|uniref:hypothetical protein n=1 Tax=Streptomyces sp. NPDC091272 TaxID=3365981 RepID=UPI0037FD6E1E